MIAQTYVLPKWESEREKESERRARERKKDVLRYKVTGIIFHGPPNSSSSIISKTKHSLATDEKCKKLSYTQQLKKNKKLAT